MNVACSHDPSVFIERLVDARSHVSLLGCGHRGKYGLRKKEKNKASDAKPYRRRRGTDCINFSSGCIRRSDRLIQGPRHVKCKLWCKKMWARAPRSCSGESSRTKGEIQPGFCTVRKPKKTAINHKGEKKSPQIRSAPNSSRVMGRPNSPPPGLLKKKIRPRKKCTFHFRANLWHEQAIRPVGQKRNAGIPGPMPGSARRGSRGLDAVASSCQEPVSQSKPPPGYSRNRPKGDCR